MILKINPCVREWTREVTKRLTQEEQELEISPGTQTETVKRQVKWSS